MLCKEYSSFEFYFRPRPHVSGDFCIHKFFYADTPSVHTCPPYTLGVSSLFPREIFQNGGEQKCCVETSSKQTRKPRIWRQNYRRLSFLCNAHALLTNPLRCPDTNRIRVDGRIRFVYATCGRRYFCIRIKKFADTKISGYVWTGPQSNVWYTYTC